jgi:hypothetical protein
MNWNFAKHRISVVYVCSYNSTPQYAFMAWCSVKKHRDNFTFYLLQCLRIFINIELTLKSGCLRVDKKLTLYKALTTSILTYARSAWEFVVDSYHSKLQRLQNKVLRTTGNLPRRTLTWDLHMAFWIPYIHDFVIKLCRQQVTVTLNQENVNIRNTSQSEGRHRKYKRLKLGGGQAYDRSIV